MLRRASPSATSRRASGHGAPPPPLEARVVADADHAHLRRHPRPLASLAASDLSARRGGVLVRDAVRISPRLLASSLLEDEPPPPSPRFRPFGRPPTPARRSRRAFPTRTASSPAWGRACLSGRRCGCGSARRSGCGRSTRPRRRRCLACAQRGASGRFDSTTRSGPSRAPSTSPTSPAASSQDAPPRVQEEERRLRLQVERLVPDKNTEIVLACIWGGSLVREPPKNRGLTDDTKGAGSCRGVRAVSGGVPEPVPPARREPVLPGLRVRRELAGGGGDVAGGPGVVRVQAVRGERQAQGTERRLSGAESDIGKRSERDPRTQDASVSLVVTLKFFKLAGEAVALIDDRPARAAVGHTVGRLLARGFFSAARLR